jgi:hypothetical protein
VRRLLAANPVHHLGYLRFDKLVNSRDQKTILALIKNKSAFELCRQYGKSFYDTILSQSSKTIKKEAAKLSWIVKEYPDHFIDDEELKKIMHETLENSKNAKN